MKTHDSLPLFLCFPSSSNRTRQEEQDIYSNRVKSSETQAKNSSTIIIHAKEEHKTRGNRKHLLRRQKHRREKEKQGVHDANFDETDKRRRGKNRVAWFFNHQNEKMFQTICSFSSLLSSHVTSYLMFLPLPSSLLSSFSLRKIMNIDLKAQLVIKMGANIFFFPLSASFIASLISLNRMTCKLKEVPEEKQHSSQERERDKPKKKDNKRQHLPLVLS